MSQGHSVNNKCGHITGFIRLTVLEIKRKKENIYFYKHPHFSVQNRRQGSYQTIFLMYYPNLT